MLLIVRNYFLKKAGRVFSVRRKDNVPRFKFSFFVGELL